MCVVSVCGCMRIRLLSVGCGIVWLRLVVSVHVWLYVYVYVGEHDMICLI